MGIRPLFVGFMFFIRKFPGWYAGGRVITITHYTHFKFLLSKFSQIMAKIIIMNVGIDKTFLKFKFSQEIINNGEKCGRLMKNMKSPNSGLKSTAGSLPHIAIVNLFIY